jgi:hypothetical protein
MLSNHTMAIDGKMKEHDMVVDTYFRKIHVPFIYFEQYIKEVAVPDYTCSAADD